MGLRTPIYICLLCIVLAHVTAAQAQGRRSSQDSVELGDRHVSVDTARDGSSVSTSSSAVGRNSASASATSVSRAEGDKRSTFGAGSAEADGESVELAVSSETPVQPPLSQDTAARSSADTPAEAPAPQESSDPPVKDEDATGAIEETSEEKDEEPYKVDPPAPAPAPGTAPEPSPEEPEHKVLIVGQRGTVTADSVHSQEKKAPQCWGEVANRCCNSRDVVTNRYGTFCGCPASYKKWGIGYCRYKLATKSPHAWQYINRFSPRYGTSCQCGEETYPVKEEAPVCSGIVKHQCCDYYDGSSDKCRCIFVGTKHEKCFWTKIQDSPLTWQDEIILRGRKCRCPGR